MKQFLLLTICLFLSIYTSAQTAPVASPDTQTTNEDTPVTFNVTTNDTGIDGAINVSTVDLDPSTIGIQNTFTVSGEGNYQTNSLGDVTFTPVANYNGTATPVNYTVNDVFGTTSNISTISITVTTVNDMPSFTKGANQTVCENSGAQTVNNWATVLSAGPPDESSQTLSFTVTNDNNTLFSVQPTIDAIGNLTYTPTSNQSGSATIFVHINDNGGIANGGVDKSADQTFIITINPLPTVYTITGGGSYCLGGSGVSIGLSGSQTGVAYQLYSGASPVGLSVAGTGSVISFGNQTTAGTNYNVIGKNVSTTCTQSMNGTTAITVNALPPLPTVSTSTPSNICPLKTVDLTLLLTSAIPIGGAILYKTTNDPLGLSIPDPTKVGAGIYYIFYQSSSGCYSISTAVTVTVNNCPPIANSATNAAIPSTAGATAISAMTATDSDGTIASYTVLTLPSHGTLFVGGIAVSAGQVLTLLQVATLTYDPIGSFVGNDTFTFTATDNNNAVSNTATISIPIGNNPPVANSATNAIMPSTAGATAITALTATDTDGTIASYTILTLPAHGTLFVGGIAALAGQVLTLAQVATLTYDPSGTFTGNDTFTFTATDNSGATDTSPATITIPIGNNPPVANSATNATIPSTAAAIAISALSGTDTDGTIAGYTILTLPSHGTLYVGGIIATTVQILFPSQAATLTYDPSGTFTGNDTFTFIATDNNGGVSLPATITIPVGNNSPVANSATNAAIPSTAGATAISAMTATDSDGTIASYTVLTLPSHGTLFVGGIAVSAGQVLTLLQVATLTYDPIGSFVGNDTFTFTATDNNNAVSNTATISIPIGNNPPVANSATNAIMPSTAGATAITALTATDTDGTIASYTILTLPAHGTLFVGGVAVSIGQVLTLAQATTLSYDPSGTFIGNDTFTFKATDNNNTVSNTATITIPVGNNPPVANSSTNATIPSTAGATAISALTATDTDGTLVSYTVLTLPTHGTLFVGGIAMTAGQVLTLVQVASLTYDPSGTFTGNDTFTFTVTDNSGATDPSPATITIPIGNNSPVAYSATNATIPSTAGATPISALSGTDSDGTINGFTILTLPLHGSLSVEAVPVTTAQVLTIVQASKMTYNPTGNFTGNDIFTFTAIDNNGGVSPFATITLPVGNNPPVAINETNSTIPSTAGATPISALTATDTDGTITGYKILTLTTHGPLFVSGIAVSIGQVLTPSQAASLTYDPSGTFTGNDTFTFTATDNNNAVSNTATITIPVGNNPPVANDGVNATISSTADATAISALTATDTDGTIANFSVLTLPLHGTLSVGGTAITVGQVLTTVQAAAIAYDPSGTFIGNDTFTFLATDNSNAVSNTATITIPISNNPPVAINATNTTIPSTAGATSIAALTATDTDGTIVSYTILTLTTHGTLFIGSIAITAGQVLTPAQVSAIIYLPNGIFTGNDSFIFTATDNSGAIDTTPATITIPVGNNPPIANPDTETTNEDTPVSFNVTSNDIDSDGTIDVSTVDLNPLTAGRQTTFTVSGQGTYTVNNSGVVIFTPFSNFNGAATPVNYTVDDNTGVTSNIATISVIVNPLNDSPVANADTKTTTENTPVTFNVTTNDTDIDGIIDVATVDMNPLNTGRQTTFVVIGQGNYTVDNLGFVTFTPAANFYGVAAPVNYTVNDNNGAISNISTITITVTPLNAAPVPVDDNATTTQNVNVTISVLTNDSFGINGPSTGSISASNGSHGTVQIVDGGTIENPTDDKIIYTPNSAYIGSDVFTYTICNSKGSCSTANVSVTVRPLSDIFIINKRSTKPIINRDGVKFSWSYIITLINKQSQLVDSIRIVDDLNKVFDVSPKPTFTVTKISASGNTLNVNNVFNGINETNLLSDRSYLKANSRDSITVEVNVNPAGYAGELLNTVYFDGLAAVGRIKGAPSDDATLPGAFDPTITVLPIVDLTIPEGFTPNGDGYNDNFVIVHTDLVKLKLLVFNRWGNQVYSSNDYKNDWNGKGPGGNDLPAGTYFLETYVIEVSTGSILKSEMRSIILIR